MNVIRNLKATAARLRRAAAREEGQLLVMVGGFAIVLFGITGLAVDVGQLYITKAQLSRAMDAAALAGVLELNGTPTGLTNAETVCEAYLTANGVEPSDANCTPDPGGDNLITVTATKSVRTFFIRVLGIDSTTVKSKAKAGFGVASVDAVMVIDATASMVGDPITNAKQAANDFKSALIGTTPDGRTLVGVAPFRGCYQPSPLPASQSSCINNTQITALSSNLATITTGINSITAGGGSAGTNVCTGLARGWTVLNGAGNHSAEENARRYMVLLSDGDNYYPGNYTYQGPLGTTAPSSPDGVAVGGTNYPCQPYDSCSSPWNTSPSTPCHTGIFTSTATAATENFGSSATAASETFSSSTTISDNFPSACTNWGGGSGWLAAWTRTGSGNNAPALITGTSPNDTTCHVRMQGTGDIKRTFSLSGAVGADLTYYAKYGSWEGTESALVQVSTDGSTWTTLRTHNTGNTTTSYGAFTANLDAYAGQSTVYLRVLGAMPAGDATDQFYVDTVSITSCAGWSGGSGWSANWTVSPSSGNDKPAATSTGTPNDTTCHLRLRGVGAASRTVNLSTAGSATLTYYAKTGGWEGGDSAVVEASSDGTTWTTLQTHTSNTTYTSYSASLDAYTGQSTVYVRFRGIMTADDLNDQFYADTISVTTCGTWSGGTGWTAAWTRSPSSGNDMPSIISTSSPYDTTCHARLRGTGSISRTVDLASVSAASVTYHAKTGGWEGGDSAVLEASTNGTSWTTVQTHTSNTTYSTFTVNLDAYTGATAYLRFRGAMTPNDVNDQFYVDAITVTTGASGSANGYLNGNDGSNPATCNESPTPRERQLDVRTLNLARALKAQGVEIFVVAFTAPSIPGCNLGSGTIWNDGDTSECNSVVDSPAGPIGDNTSDTSANVRLLRCIASSKDETKDHYYYASTAAELPAVFSQIAKYISHRLVE